MASEQPPAAQAPVETINGVSVAPSVPREERVPRSRADRAATVDVTPSDVPIDEEDRERFEAIVEAQRTGEVVPDYWRGRYQNEGLRNWDKFYKQNTTNFFKDRHYLDRLFGELKEHDAAYRAAVEAGEVDAAEPAHRGKFARTLFEVGCGVGNAFLPLTTDFPWLRCVGVDISRRAVEFAAQRETFDADRTAVWQCDLALDPLPPPILENKSEFATLIFVLSAIAPSHMVTALRKAYDSLKPGGLLLIRDYGAWDMTQLRFKAKNYIAENEYVRHNGTLTYFFTTEKIAELLGEAGFEVVENAYHRKVIRNFKRNLVMKRVWLHCKARKPLDAAE